jgi:hypothetical protein
MKEKNATCPAIQRDISDHSSKTNATVLTIGKDNVSHREECLPEDNRVLWSWPKGVAIRSCAWVLDANSNHGDDDSDTHASESY